MDLSRTWSAGLGDRDQITCPSDVASGLFYTTGAGVVIGTSPLAVLTAAGGGGRLDADWPGDWLSRRADPSRTPFEGLRRLLPGQRLRIDAGRPLVTDTIGPRVWGRPDLDGEQALTAFHNAFTDALRRIVPAGEVSSELSGGLDSTYMVGCLARRGDVRVHGYTWTPDPRADVPDGATGDLDLAELLRERHPEAIDLEPVISHGSPLRTARELARRALWPAFGPSSLPWSLEIRRRAAGAGAAFVLTGVHGNAAFSADHRRTRLRSRLRRTRPRSAGFLRDSGPGPRRRTREQWLAWLAGHTDIYAGIDTPGVFPIPRRDPYRAPEVLAVAARITPRAWRQSGLSRGFARTLAEGVVPDPIRLNPTRFVQASDVWFAMYDDRELYDEQLSGLRNTPELTRTVDFDRVASAIRSWPWGSPSPAPPLIETASVNRILALAQFIADARAITSQT